MINPPLVNSELVSNDPLSLHRLSTTDSAIPRPAATHCQCRCPIFQSSHPTGRLAYFAQSLRNKGVSAEAKELILSAWTMIQPGKLVHWQRRQSHFCIFRVGTFLSSFTISQGTPVPLSKHLSLDLPSPLHTQESMDSKLGNILWLLDWWRVSLINVLLSQNIPQPGQWVPYSPIWGLLVATLIWTWATN